MNIEQITASEKFHTFITNSTECLIFCIMPPYQVRPSYINNLIHKIVAGGWVEGGDIVDESGGGGESIYGATFDG